MTIGSGSFKGTGSVNVWFTGVWTDEAWVALVYQKYQCKVLFT